MFNTARALTKFAILTALVGCAGNGEGLDQNGKPINAGSANSVLIADFDSIQDQVFTPVCTVCHSGAAAPRGLRLDAGNSYTLLVGVASAEIPALQRVRPGDPNASYLLQKLTGAAAIGQRMPLGGPYLSQATIDVIRQWIANGAQRSVALAGTNGLHVVTTAPLDGATVAGSFAQIVIGFDRELDVSLVNSTTVSLEKLNAASTESITTHLAVPTSNVATLLVTPQTPLAPGTYRLTLRGSGNAALAGLNALPLNASQENIGADSIVTFAIAEQP